MMPEPASRRPLPVYLAGWKPPPRNADSAQRVAWMRGYLRFEARYQAMLHVTGEAMPPEGSSWVLWLAGRVARDLRWPGSVAVAAWQAEWPLALEYIRSRLQRVVWEVKPRIARRDPGIEVLAAARVADGDNSFPDQVLTSLCARIAQAGGRRRGRRA